MRGALGFVLDFTAIFIAMSALAGTTLGAIAFALLFDGAAPFYQCMDPSSLGPAMTSPDRRNGTGGAQAMTANSLDPPPTSRCSTAAKTLGNPSIHVDVRHVNLHYATHLRNSFVISYCAAKSAPAPGRDAAKVSRTPNGMPLA